MDPDSELIDEVAASAANAPDRDAAGELLGGHTDSEDKQRSWATPLTATRPPARTWKPAGFTLTAMCPPARNAASRFPKDRFTVDLGAGTVTCPAGQTAVIVPAARGGGRASFRPWCATCPLRQPAPRRGAGVGRHQRVSRAAELAVERARYDADRGARAFCACEPENRLVARTLEARW